MKKMFSLIMIVFSVMILSGCRTTRTVEKQVPVQVYTTKYDTINKIINHHDSVFELDSVYFNGNTVYKVKYRNKYMIHQDTIFKSRVDSVDRPVYLTNTVTKTEKYVPKIYKASMWFAVIVILLAGVYVVIRLKLYKKIKL